MTSIRTIKKRYESIHDAVSNLVDEKFFFQEYQNYIQSSSQMDKQNEFLYFISVNYLASAALGVFRQVDGNKRSQSLRNLLKEILKNHSLFTLDSFSGKTKKGPQALFMDKNSFAQFALADGKRLSIRKVKSDIVLLLKSTKAVVKYRHKVIAHKNRRKISIKATVNDLYSAIDCLEKLVIKYNVLFNNASTPTLLASNSNPQLDKIFMK